MRTKSAYRGKPATETPDPHILEEKIQPSETVNVDFATDEPAVAVVSADEFPQPDEATLALQKQLADLRKSEEMQRELALHVQAQRMAQQQQQPPTHAALLQAWRSQGADEGDLAFLESNPSLMDNPRLCRLASDEAAEHHQRGTDAHRQATKEIFDRHLGHQQAQPAASAQPTPAFFQPPEAPRLPAAPDRAALYSAPVSRRDAGGPREPPNPRSVRLSPAEQEHARIAGISDLEFAKQKLKLAQAKAAGDYAERR